MKTKVEDGSLVLSNRSKQSIFGKKLKKSAPLYVLLLPSIILLICFFYIPLYGIVIAFKDYSPALGFWGSPWVGFKHFIQFFNSYQFDLTIKNTLTIGLYSILVGFPLPIALAILCNQIRVGMFKKVFQVTTYLPHFISTMVMCGMILIFLSPSNGLFANLLSLIGVEMPNILSNPSAFSSIYVWSDVWQHVGWDSIIFLAALSAINPTYYEAATMDGAGKLQKILHIDLPLLLPTAMILLILRAGNVLSVGFEKVLLLQNPLNLAGSEVISTYVYKVGLQNFEYSLSTAIGLFNSVVNVIILLLVNWISKRLTKTSLL
ncbi:ABC transporter permease [Gracilibacillus alcaliphilus]|uniref:ABC transporter permease n=1 Tax=Gracilibacillus alcaliphilus TaxID=1401441 RepID=UPI001957B115|nr:ABC transporter permease subunit [Gracilibacillus alcaliphilus]MBM7675563.1 putative aldouronate transport system permease protein [Gracilibacillus alcaliphilus]